MDIIIIISSINENKKRQHNKMNLQFNNKTDTSLSHLLPDLTNKK